MILVDANLLLYAVDSTGPWHRTASDWWESLLAGGERVGLSWPVLTASVRIGTNPRVYERPLSILSAVAIVRGWLTQPVTPVLVPTSRHWQVLADLLLQTGAGGNLVSDAHLAALAIEHGATLASSDSDFSRFAGLEWVNPLD
ncbi:MAG: type II toxin-antitoxin system VapC family toxin [Fimbriimonadaceae bacterium]|nr:type II toxin-antitoxin system VapC family toxin [Fimbriimonadaceae bacterium]